MDTTGRHRIHTKHDFKQISNPLDLFKIAIFDIHIHNTDRNEQNHNLLIQRGAQDTIYAIDHFYAFGGKQWKPSEPKPPNIHNGLLKTSYFSEVVQYIDYQGLQNVLQAYIDKCNKTLSEKIEDIFSVLPETWEYPEDLKDNIINFVSNRERNQQMQELIDDYIRYLKTRK